MKQFQFRMQPVLQMRMRERDAAADAYQQANAAIEKLQAQIDETLAEYESQRPVQAEWGRGAIASQRLLESHRYQGHLLSVVEDLRGKVRLIDAERERRRLLLVQREQHVRSLERLRESQLKEWQLAADRKEQETLDDWAGFKYWSRSTSGDG